MEMHRGTHWRFIKRASLAWLICAVVASMLVPGPPVRAQQGDNEALPGRVVVAFWPPSTVEDEVGAQQLAVAQAQVDVLASVDSTDVHLIHRYQTVPGMVVVVNEQGLATLRHHPQVRAIAPDLPVFAALTESAALIRADRVWSDLGFTGAGVNVAVLDSGLDTTHPDLSDSIVAQHCFNHGTCPPGDTDESDSAQDEHGHGTHVAGIITGRGGTSPRGIAPDTGIVAVRVLNNTGSGWTSDVVAGIDWVIANQAGYNIRVMNLSLGGGTYPAVCDTHDANSMLYAAAVQSARQAGIVVFAASGNGGLADKMMTPACISGVISVGSTYDANLGPFSWGSSSSPICVDADATVDQVTCTSNSSPVLDLLAPGALITSAALGGGPANRSGTSMAVPHASGVAALMLQAQPGLTPAQIESVLKQTGTGITDPRNGQVAPRVDALEAVRQVTQGSAASISGTVLLPSRTTHDGITIFLGAGPCGDPVAVNPTTATDAQGYFEIAVGPGASYQCLRATQLGHLAAQRESPAGNIGVVTLFGGDVNGDSVINIFDLALIASSYGGQDPASDINADGTVDIFDLAITASNYEKQGPITAWQ